MDIDRSDMIGFSLPPIAAPVPDPVHELHLQFLAERELVREGGRKATKKKSPRVPAKWDEKEQQRLGHSYWHELEAWGER